MTIDQAAERLQFSYPQVYHACHTRHERRQGRGGDSVEVNEDLAVARGEPKRIGPSALARHMDLARSTLSEALTNLEALGYVAKSTEGRGDRRRVGLVLTSAGVDAVRGSSVLESGRLRVVLARLSDRDRATAVRGLDLLARASRPAPAGKRR